MFVTNNQILGLLLKDTRQIVRLSQKEIVDEMNSISTCNKMAYSTYSRIESGEVTLSTLQLEAFSIIINKYNRHQFSVSEFLKSFRTLVNKLIERGINVSYPQNNVKPISHKELVKIVRDNKLHIIN